MAAGAVVAPGRLNDDVVVRSALMALVALARRGVAAADTDRGFIQSFRTSPSDG